MGALVEATLSRWLDPGNLGTPAPWLAALRTMMLATPIEGFAACAGALMAFDTTRALGHFCGPTTLLVGRSDGELPQAMQAMAEQIGTASFHRIENAGHMPNLEQPASFQACLDRFMTS